MAGDWRDILETRKLAQILGLPESVRQAREESPVAESEELEW